MNYDDNNNNTSNDLFNVPPIDNNNQDTYQAPVYTEENLNQVNQPDTHEDIYQENPQQIFLQGLQPTKVDITETKEIHEEPVVEQIKPELIPTPVVDEKFLESIRPVEEPQSNKSFLPDFDVSISDKKAINKDDDEVKSKATINNLMANDSTDLYQNGPRVYAVPKQKTNVFAVILLTVIVLTVAGYFTYTFMDTATKKMVCESEMGNITITYNKNTVVGYKSNKITYDLYEQRTYADEIGIKQYLDEFEQWFKDNTQGSCKR